MQITFNSAELLQLLHESSTFRSIYLNLTIDPLIAWGEKIKKQFPLFASDQKIPAIKWLRTETQNRREILKMFNDAGYECYSNDSCLGLAASKKFIESC